MTPHDMRQKRYVQVVSSTSARGDITPLQVVWDDGRRFNVEHVLDNRSSQALGIPGAAVRYTVRVHGHPTYLWLEGSRWFVEAKG